MSIQNIIDSIPERVSSVVEDVIKTNESMIKAEDIAKKIIQNEIDKFNSDLELMRILCGWRARCNRKLYESN